MHGLKIYISPRKKIYSLLWKRVVLLKKDSQ